MFVPESVGLSHAEVNIMWALTTIVSINCISRMSQGIRKMTKGIKATLLFKILK